MIILLFQTIPIINTNKCFHQTFFILVLFFLIKEIPFASEDFQYTRCFAVPRPSFLVLLHNSWSQPSELWLYSILPQNEKVYTIIQNIWKKNIQKNIQFCMPFNIFLRFSNPLSPPIINKCFHHTFLYWFCSFW